MKFAYIEEKLNANNFINKVITKIKCFFNVIDKESNDKYTIYYLPISGNDKTRKSIIKRLSNKLIMSLENSGINTIVLSSKMQQLIYLKNNLFSQNINILDGRYLFKILSIQIIEYILKIKNENIENSEISILVNDLNDINKKVIIDIAKKVRTLNVITNNISKCKRIEKYLYNEYGIMLNISNNKKTSLLKSKIIINIDFPEEILNQYRIYNQAVIVNILDRIEIQSKKFNGINVNYYSINIPDTYKIKGFKDEEIYESIIYNYNYEQIQEIIEKEDIEIKGLIGNNGIILKEEFLYKL